LCCSFFCCRSNFPLCSRLWFSALCVAVSPPPAVFLIRFSARHQLVPVLSVFVFGAGFGLSPVRCPDFFVDSSVAPKRAVAVLGSRRTRWFLLRVFVSSDRSPSNACSLLDFSARPRSFCCQSRAGRPRDLQLQLAPADQSPGLGPRDAVPRPSALNVFPASLTELMRSLDRSRSKVSSLFLSLSQGSTCILFCHRSASSFHQAKISTLRFCFPVPARSCRPVFIVILGNPHWATLRSSVVASACCRFRSGVGFYSAPQDFLLRPARFPRQIFPAPSFPRRHK
jgi:hypothetical protein